MPLGMAPACRKGARPTAELLGPAALQRSGNSAGQRYEPFKAFAETEGPAGQALWGLFQLNFLLRSSRRKVQATEKFGLTVLNMIH